MATERWERGAWRRVISIIVVVWFGGILAACGSGATEGPDDDSVDDGFPAPTGQDDDASGGNRGDGGGDDGDIEFTFSLPTGPVGPTGEDDPVFEALRDQGCGAAQSELDSRRDRLVERAVLLYQAAIHLCWGDRDQAGQVFDQITLPLWTQACPWYQAIGSVLQQQQPSSIFCPTDDDADGDGGDTTQTTDNGGDGDGDGDGSDTTDTDGEGDGGAEGDQSDSS